MDVSSQPTASKEFVNVKTVVVAGYRGDASKAPAEQREFELVGFQRQMLGDMRYLGPCVRSTASLVAGVTRTTWNFALSIQLSNWAPHWSKPTSFD